MFVRESNVDQQAEIDRLNAELDTANRRANLLESDLTRLRAAHAEAQRQLLLAAESPVSASPPREIMDIEVVPSSSVSSSGDESDLSAQSGPSSMPKELNAKNVMMALLMILSPVLTHDSRQQHQHQRQPPSSSDSHHRQQPQTLPNADSSFSSLFPVQSAQGFIPTTPFEQFLKPEMLASIDPSSFYTTADLDMNAELSLLNMPSFGQPSQSQPSPHNFVSVATSYESGYGELDLLKSPTSLGSSSSSSSNSLERAVELEVEILRDPQDSSKVRIRLVGPFLPSGGIESQALPRDFLGFPPSPTVGLDGVSYSFGSAGKMQQQERKRVRISLDSNQGLDVHVEEC